ncbi:hypothetical protein SAMN02745673_02004 [Marinactinospora thermotolerans DSM 45154]|uniref:Uncharacterized protein n=1 Tax=Marinactinospora thermotolerans DSM 45154 TaxID=1122192 RepID=A0A1T4PTZ4_9ACTN|nr:hypothetical protein SAMN02745673_02004 [Marinactinospora thermotolerans DSM 45154]
MAKTAARNRRAGIVSPSTPGWGLLGRPALSGSGSAAASRGDGRRAGAEGEAALGDTARWKGIGVRPRRPGAPGTGPRGPMASPEKSAQTVAGHLRHAIGEQRRSGVGQFDPVENGDGPRQLGVVQMPAHRANGLT